MKTIIVSLLGGIPGAVLAVLSQILTRPLFEYAAERAILAGLDYVAESTTNTLDDQIVAEVRRRLATPQPLQVPPPYDDGAPG